MTEKKCHKTRMVKHNVTGEYNINGWRYGKIKENEQVKTKTERVNARTWKR